MNFLKIAKDLAFELYNQQDEDVCGMDGEIQIENYKIEVTAFWEKVRHFEYSVTDMSGEIVESKTLITF
jgi:hypothetical protein